MELGHESGSGVLDIEGVALSAVGSEADFVDEVDHGVHDGEKDFLDLFTLFLVGSIIGDEEPFSSNSSDDSDSFGHLVVKIHPVLGGVVL